MNNARDGGRDFRRDREFEDATHAGNAPGSPSTAAVPVIMLIVLIDLAFLHLRSRGPSHGSRSQPLSSKTYRCAYQQPVGQSWNKINPTSLRH
jgi:hypothetical protein